VRSGHWALVAAFAVAFFSPEEEAGGPGAWHVWSGYVVGGIVLLRVLWGFVGPRHARFSEFVCKSLKALVYLRDLLLSRARRYVGHSPAGGAMVIALLVCLAATVATGVIAYGEQGKGPLAAALVTDVNANGTEARHRARPEKGGERTESVIGEWHELLADITMALVVVHILGVALASFVHQENLVLAMISGRKRRARD
jgi:cytochrome b